VVELVDDDERVLLPLVREPEDEVGPEEADEPPGFDVPELEPGEPELEPGDEPPDVVDECTPPPLAEPDERELALPVSVPPPVPLSVGDEQAAKATTAAVDNRRKGDLMDKCSSGFGAVASIRAATFLRGTESNGVTAKDDGGR
jgi:hypothetical protein